MEEPEPLSFEVTGLASQFSVLRYKIRVSVLFHLEQFQLSLIDFTVYAPEAAEVSPRL
jgi:hypothetical protein